MVHGSLAADQAFRVRFRREVAAAQAVSGAYTASVVAAGPDDDPPWMATEFVPGPSLWEAVTTTGPLPADSVWRLAAGLVEALQAVHSCGLVHRDLKPQNVLLAEDGPRLIDFGVCQALGDSAVTATGLIVGTPPYMSPEQAKGKRAGAASDVFSLGCVLAFAATGLPPYGSGQPAAVLYRIVHAAPGARRPGWCAARHDRGVPGQAARGAALAERAGPRYHRRHRGCGPGRARARPPRSARPMAGLAEPSWPAEVASLIRDRQRPVDSQIGPEAAAAAPNTVTGAAGPAWPPRPAAGGPAGPRRGRIPPRRSGPASPGILLRRSGAARPSGFARLRTGALAAEPGPDRGRAAILPGRTAGSAGRRAAGRAARGPSRTPPHQAPGSSRSQRGRRRRDWPCWCGSSSAAGQ